MSTDVNGFKALADLAALLEIDRKAAIEEALREPSDFGYSGDNEELFKTWTLGPCILCRDSSLREETTTADFLAFWRRRYPEGQEWGVVRCSHWAVGWVDHLSFKLVDEKGHVTNIAKDLLGRAVLITEDGGICDEASFRMALDVAALENLRQVAKHQVVADLPEGWVELLDSTLQEMNEQWSLDRESNLDDAPYPDELAVEKALERLHWLENTSKDAEMAELVRCVEELLPLVERAELDFVKLPLRDRLSWAREACEAAMKEVV